jgi:hypothetical protein
VFSFTLCSDGLRYVTGYARRWSNTPDQRPSRWARSDPHAAANSHVINPSSTRRREKKRGCSEAVLITTARRLLLHWTQRDVDFIRHPGRPRMLLFIVMQRSQRSTLVRVTLCIALFPCRSQGPLTRNRASLP